MNRGACISEIVESLRQTQRVACGRLSKVPGIAVTPSQWALLNLITDSPGISIKELSKTMKVTGSAVTQLANELGEKGYIKRDTDPRDRRTTLIIPTAKCDRMMAGIQKSFAEGCGVMFAKLTDGELKTLHDLHKKIALVIKNNYSN